MTESFNKNDLYTSAQSNFKKLLEVAFSSEISAGQPLDDPQILQKIQEMTNAMNEPSENGFIVPQLFKDCSEGNYENVKEHITNCADVNEIGSDGETALGCAINSNNIQIVELLLRSGANPNCRPDKVESTPLMDASNVGYVDIVRVLLEFGANPDVKSSTNYTALHYAACGGHLECCKLMLDYSSNPQALIEEQNENGHTALMEAATSGFLEITKFLIQNGTQINTPSAEFKETALTLASYKGYSDIVQYLLEAGADHEHRTDEMHTALMEASMEGHIEAAKVLLYYGAHVNMRADSFESPLTLAACSGHTDLAAHLISYGADIEEVNDESYTPLMEASREGHLETVAMLLSLGANINRVTEETQETAMTLAACGGFFDIVLLLHRCGADIELGASTPLMESSQEGHLEIVKALLVMGAKVDAKNSSDETSLHFAAENGHVDVCRYLLDHHADIHHVSDGGKTCLMKACRAGNLEVVYLLVESGSRLDQMTTMSDHNALSMACASGHCKIVEYLLQVGADPTVKLKDNCNVLIEASRAGHIDVIEILLRDNKRDKRLLSSNQGQHMYPVGHVGRETSNAYMSTTTINGNHDMYDMDKFVNIPVGIRAQQQQPLSSSVCDYVSMSSIYTDHLSSNTQSIQQISKFHSCAFSNPLSNGSQMISNGACDNTAFVRPLMLPTEIPDPPSNPPPLPPMSNHHQLPDSANFFSSSSDDVSLPLSLLGSDNDRLLQNILDPNSPNLEEWVKDMCPNFNNNLYVTDTNYDSNLSKLSLAQSEMSCVMTPQLLQQTANSHFHRKIKKAKHSENYNTQFDLMPNKTCTHACQHRLQSSFLADSSVVVEADYGGNSKLLRSPAEGSDSVVDRKLGHRGQDQSVAAAENNDSDSDVNHVCRDCNKFHLTNSSKEYPTKKNLFSTTNNSSLNKQISLSGTSSSDSGVFSIDKNCTNVPTSSGLLLDEYQSDIKRIFNSVTPTSTSPLKPKISNQVSSTPFQKQVLQPKRRLQPNQRSPMSNTSSLSTASSVCSEHKTSLHQMKFTPPSESFHLPMTSLNGSVFDTATYSSQESSMSYSNFNFPEKNLSVEERDHFFHQSILSDFSHENGSSLHMCPLPGDCGNKHGLMSPNYHMEMTPKINIDNCDNIPARKSGMVISSNNSIDNLEVLEEIENEDNDDDVDFESDIEMDSGVPPYNTRASSNVCCNKQNCKKKLNVNVCTESLQESPLSLACSGGHIEVVKLLINSGAKLEHRDKKSQTALHVAVLNGHLEVVKFLLESGADMEAIVERTKDTALSIACTNGKLEIIEDLVQKGANIEHRNISDYTPLSLAASGGYVEIIKFLLKNNAEINSRTNSKLGISPLMLAAMNGHIDAVNVLLDSGSDINAQIETNRNTALTLACFQGRTEVVCLLVEKKAYIEHRAKSGLTPLMEAASQGHIDVGRILISAGADVNAPPVPASRETALIIAAEKGHTEFVKLLLQNNAVVDSRNKKGDTPLWLAANGGYIDVVKVLINAMSDTNNADNRRMTCLMASFKRGHVKVVKELVKYVTQFPSEHDCQKHLKSIKNDDKDLIKRCEVCKEIILKAKERQEYEAAKNAKDLLKQVEEERKAKELKEVKQAKKREKKKAKKKAKHEDKDVEVPRIEEDKDEFVSPKEEPIFVSAVPLSPEYVDPRPFTNTETVINTETVCVHVKSNKRSRTKQDPEKAKETKSDVTAKSPKEDIAQDSMNRTALVTSSDINGMVTSGKSMTKNNSWTEIHSAKVTYGGKVEESWQKIGGSKKKVDIQVNKKDIGKVIGQGGSVVNAIRHITGAHIDIDSMANDVDERTVHLKGTLEAVTKARDYICDLVDGAITGSTVIKESEPYASKAVVAVAPSTLAPTLESDYHKTAAKSVATVPRQNGKASKFANGKFAVTPMASATTGTTSLQYGFSKSSKAPDFASVAATGVVSVSSPVYPATRVKHTDKMVLSDNFPSLYESSHAETMTPLSQYVHEPLEVNTGMTQAATTSVSSGVTQGSGGGPCNNMSKSFPLAPGSERSLHQRTYNSTPEHSPQMESSHAKNNNEVASSESTITSSTSDKDDVADSFHSTAHSTVNWPPFDYQRSYQDPACAEPLSAVDFEAMSGFPKLQSLNPKAEAFSPSSGHMYGFKPDEYYYYSMNGTLTLNPTANIFKPRQTFASKTATAASSVTPTEPSKRGSPAYAPHGPFSTPPHEERSIRLQDHITMAINILLRTNGGDTRMADSAFASFMRSANLDLNTRLTTAEFTSLINNIINQSTNGHVATPPPPPPMSFLPPSSSHAGYPLDDGTGRYRILGPMATVPPPQTAAAAATSHWPPMINNLGAQSIWAPGSNGLLAAPLNSPFFPNINQCVSAQAAFNSPLQPPPLGTHSDSYCGAAQMMDRGMAGCVSSPVPSDV